MQFKMGKSELSVLLLAFFVISQINAQTLGTFHLNSNLNLRRLPTINQNLSEIFPENIWVDNNFGHIFHARRYSSSGLEFGPAIFNAQNISDDQEQGERIIFEMEKRVEELQLKFDGFDSILGQIEKDVNFDLRKLRKFYEIIKLKTNNEREINKYFKLAEGEIIFAGYTITNIILESRQEILFELHELKRQTYCFKIGLKAIQKKEIKFYFIPFPFFNQKNYSVVLLRQDENSNSFVNPEEPGLNLIDYSFKIPQDENHFIFNFLIEKCHPEAIDCFKETEMPLYFENEKIGFYYSNQIEIDSMPKIIDNYRYKDPIYCQMENAPDFLLKSFSQFNDQAFHFYNIIPKNVIFNHDINFSSVLKNEKLKDYFDCYLLCWAVIDCRLFSWNSTSFECKLNNAEIEPYPFRKKGMIIGFIDRHS